MDTTATTPRCFICTGDNLDNLVSPKCCNYTKFYHTECITKWVEHRVYSYKNDFKSTCPCCQKELLLYRRSNVPFVEKMKKHITYFAFYTCIILTLLILFTLCCLNIHLLYNLIICIIIYEFIKKIYKIFENSDYNVILEKINIAKNNGDIKICVTNLLLLVTHYIYNYLVTLIRQTVNDEDKGFKTEYWVLIYYTYLIYISSVNNNMYLDYIEYFGLRFINFITIVYNFTNDFWTRQYLVLNNKYYTYCPIDYKENIELLFEFDKQLKCGPLQTNAIDIQYIDETIDETIDEIIDENSIIISDSNNDDSLLEITNTSTHINSVLPIKKKKKLFKLF